MLSQHTTFVLSPNCRSRRFNTLIVFDAQACAFWLCLAHVSEAEVRHLRFYLILDRLVHFQSREHELSLLLLAHKHCAVLTGQKLDSHALCVLIAVAKVGEGGTFFYQSIDCCATKYLRQFPRRRQTLLEDPIATRGG